MKGLASILVRCGLLWTYDATLPVRMNYPSSYLLRHVSETPTAAAGARIVIGPSNGNKSTTSMSLNISHLYQLYANVIFFTYWRRVVRNWAAVIPYRYPGSFCIPVPVYHSEDADSVGNTFSQIRNQA